METLIDNGVTIAVADRAMRLDNTQDILDLMVFIRYNHNASGIVLFKESLPESFFELRTGLAGEILQKFSNYSIKVAIVGDFSQYKSKSLKDFIYECNEGNLVFFKSDLASAIKALTG